MKHLTELNPDDFLPYSKPQTEYYHTENPTQTMVDHHGWQIRHHSHVRYTAFALHLHPQGILPNDILSQWHLYHQQGWNLCSNSLDHYPTRLALSVRRLALIQTRLQFLQQMNWSNCQIVRYNRSIRQLKIP